MGSSKTYVHWRFSMTIETPEFQGTHLWNRLHWAKDNLDGVQTDYRVVWEDPEEPDAPAKVQCQIQTGLLVLYKAGYFHQ